MHTYVEKTTHGQIGQHAFLFINALKRIESEMIGMKIQFTRCKSDLIQFQQLLASFIAILQSSNSLTFGGAEEMSARTHIS